MGILNELKQDLIKGMMSGFEIEMAKLNLHVLLAVLVESTIGTLPTEKKQEFLDRYRAALMAVAKPSLEIFMKSSFATSGNASENEEFRKTMSDSIQKMVDELHHGIAVSIEMADQDA